MKWKKKSESYKNRARCVFVGESERLKCGVLGERRKL